MNDTENPNTDPMELLRRHWHDLDIDAAGLDDANREISRRLARGVIAPTQDKICDRLRRRFFLGLALTPLAYLMYATMGIPLWVCVVYAVFGLIMSLLKRGLVRYIGSSRLMELPVAEAYVRALDIRRRRNRLRQLGIGLGVFVIISLLMAIFDSGSQAMLWGAGCGLVFGIIVAVSVCINENRLYRRLIDSLKEEE